VIAMTIALTMAQITGYTTPKLRIYNAECQFEREVAKDELPEPGRPETPGQPGKPGPELLPPNGVCNRPSIMWNSKRIWLAPAQVTIEGPPCVKVSLPGSNNSTGTDLGSSPGGAKCIPTNE